MAKKSKAEGVLAKGTRRKAEADALAAAERAAEAEKEAAALRRVVTPRPARPKKVKKARFVREQKEKRVPAAAVELPARSTTAAGKLMSRNIPAKPKEGSKAGGTGNRGNGR